MKKKLVKRKATTKKTGSIRPPFKIHGGKYYLSRWIIEHFPPNYEKMHYIEPFCGAASVLLNKEPSVEEIINDLDPNVATLLGVLRDQPEDLVKALKKIKYKEKVFLAALEKNVFADDLDRAVNEFILRRMSRDGLKKEFAWSDRLRGGQPGDVNAWKTIIALLPSIAARLKNVYILNQKAVKILQTFNAPEYLVYADPPYLPETRVSKDAYEYEMSVSDHLELAKVLNNFKGKVILSGYPSPAYAKLYSGWRTKEREIKNHASQQKKKAVKTETIWMNF